MSLESIRDFFRRKPKTSRHERKLLDALSHELDLVEKTIPMKQSYVRVDPYIIDCNQGGMEFKFIVYHIESKLWFDNDRPDWALNGLAKSQAIKPGDVVFDLGCNSGFLTSWFAKTVGPKGRVVAFDPFPWNAIATKYSALLNGCENVECHAIGISNRAETIKIPYEDSKTYVNEIYSQNTFDARLLPLDDFAHLRPNFIKVDIEGAERDLLAGSQRILSQKPKPIWFLEIHNEFIEAAGSDPAQIARDFLASDYDCRIGALDGEKFGKCLPNGCALYAKSAMAA